MHKLAPAVALGFAFCASNVLADEQSVVSARVVSFESAETLARTACALTAIANVGGRARRFDISVDGDRCSSLAAQDDAIPPHQYRAAG